MKRVALVAGVLLTAAGCAASTPPSRDPGAPPPTDEERLREVLRGAERGPTHWNPAVTIPLYPLILAIDTSVKFSTAAVEFFKRLPEGLPGDPAPFPDWLEGELDALYYRR